MIVVERERKLMIDEFYIFLKKKTNDKKLELSGIETN